MIVLAAIGFVEPSYIAAWLALGLASGWLASKAMEAASYGIVGDLLLGSIGALVGGFGFSFFREGDPGLFGSSLRLHRGGACRLCSSKRVTPTGFPF